MKIPYWLFVTLQLAIVFGTALLYMYRLTDGTMR